VLLGDDLILYNNDSGNLFALRVQIAREYLA